MKLGSALHMPTKGPAYSPSSRLVLPRDLIGLEIEVENCLPPTGEDMALLDTHWTYKRDDSLRNNGLEWAFKQPLFGKDVIDAVQNLCLIARKRKWQTSYRTSFQVHSDMRSEDFDTFKALCAVYAIVEPALYDWIGDHRDESIFCLPWFTADNDIPRIKDLLSLKSEQFILEAESIHRYSGLNLNSLARFGSIEWRHMQTTFDEERILDWINICLSIKKYARQVGVQTNIGTYLLDTFSRHGPEEFLHLVFGPIYAPKLLKTLKNLDFYRGVMLAQELLQEDLLKGLKVVFDVPNFPDLVPGENQIVKRFLKKHKKKRPKTSEWVVYDPETPPRPGFVFHPYVLGSEDRRGYIFNLDEHNAPATHSLRFFREETMSDKRIHEWLAGHFQYYINSNRLGDRAVWVREHRCNPDQFTFIDDERAEGRGV